MKDKRKRVRDPGLWHGPLRVQIEIVKRAHKKRCDHCGEMPETRRLRLVEGSGRAATTRIYCEVCGEAWFDDHEAECRRARTYLMSGNVTIREVEST